MGACGTAANFFNFGTCLVGDCNLDGIVDSTEAAFLRRAFLGQVAAGLVKANCWNGIEPHIRFDDVLVPSVEYQLLEAEDNIFHAFEHVPAPPTLRPTPTATNTPVPPTPTPTPNSPHPSPTFTNTATPTPSIKCEIKITPVVAYSGTQGVEFSLQITPAQYWVNKVKYVELAMPTHPGGLPIGFAVDKGLQAGQWVKPARTGLTVYCFGGSPPGGSTLAVEMKAYDKKPENPFGSHDPPSDFHELCKASSSLQCIAVPCLSPTDPNPYCVHQLVGDGQAAGGIVGFVPLVMEGGGIAPVEIEGLM
jgi:hypothetical protein